MKSGSFVSGSDVVAANPHPVFDKIGRRGYRIAYRLEDEGPEDLFFQDESSEDLFFRELFVCVLAGDIVIGSADFTHDTVGAYPQTTAVEPAYLRQGIANAMYVFAERVLGRWLENSWDGAPQQSAAAKAQWAQPNRPFGNPPAPE
jgi:hypothetical protein